MKLLVRFSGEVDAYEREGRKNRRPTPSVMDKAIEVFHVDQEVPQDKPNQNDLAIKTMMIRDNTAHCRTMRKQISTLVKNGPQQDATMQADVIFAT